MMRSGRILSAVRMSWRMVISPAPSMFGFLASRRTRLGAPRICSSALSSMVMIRSSPGMNWDRAFKRVVFPDPVPAAYKDIVAGDDQFFQKGGRLLAECPEADQVLHGDLLGRKFPGSSPPGPFKATG